MVYAGAPSRNLHAIDIQQDFISLGYDLFSDRETLQSQFVSRDFFAKDNGLAQGAYDIIYATSFFHLYEWNEQVDVIEQTIGLLKQRQGSMMFGRQPGLDAARTVEHPSAKTGKMFVHDETSFRRLMQEVGKRTRTTWKVEVDVSRNERWEVRGVPWRKLKFTLTMSEQGGV